MISRELQLHIDKYEKKLKALKSPPVNLRELLGRGHVFVRLKQLKQRPLTTLKRFKINKIPIRNKSFLLRVQCK